MCSMILRASHAETAHSRGRQVSLTVLYLASLPSPLRSPAPPLNGFRRLGSRQARKRLSRPRHWLQPTAAPARYLAVTGSFGCEGAAITAGEKNGDRQHDGEDHPNDLGNPMTSTEQRRFGDQEIAQSATPTRIVESSAPEDPAFERHYRIGELAAKWQLGRETVRLLVKDERGVIKIRLGRKKANTSYSVPESVAVRIHTRLLNSR